jgi:hypothetical protein
MKGITEYQIGKVTEFSALDVTNFKKVVIETQVKLRKMHLMA